MTRTRKLHKAAWGWAAAVACLSLARPSSASDEALAEALFQEGQRLMGEARYTEACAKFAESLRIDASIGTLMNLAHCRESEGKLATAWALYAKGANQARLAGQTERYDYAQERVNSLAPRLSKLVVTVDGSTDSTGIYVTLDGEPVTSSAFGFPLPVDSGDHIVTASREGYQPWKATVNVARDGITQTIQIPALVPVAAAAPVAAAPAAPPQSEQPPPEPESKDDPEEQEPEPDENMDEDARQRFRALVNIGFGWHHSYTLPDTFSGPLAYVSGGVQKHFVPYFGFSARGGVAIEALLISPASGFGPDDTGSALTVFFDAAAIVGPLGPLFLGAGPWIGINTFLDTGGGPNTAVGFQGIGGFMFGSRDQVQLAARIQPGTWIDGAAHLRVLFEFGLAFP